MKEQGIDSKLGSSPYRGEMNRNGLLERFKVSTTWSGRKRIFTVCVYDTVENLRAAGRRYTRIIGTHETLERAHGLVQSSVHYNYCRRGRETLLPGAGIIRLYKDALGAGLLAHECAHAALAIYRQDVKRPLSRMKNEEVLCYMIGHFMTQIVRRLYAKGFYDGEGVSKPEEST